MCRNTFRRAFVSTAYLRPNGSNIGCVVSCELVAPTREYVALVDGCASRSPRDFLAACARLLPRIYAVGMDLPIRNCRTMTSNCLLIHSSLRCQRSVSFWANTINTLKCLIPYSIGNSCSLIYPAILRIFTAICSFRFDGGTAAMMRHEPRRFGSGSSTSLGIAAITSSTHYGRYTDSCSTT